MTDAIKEHAGVDICGPTDELVRVAKSLNLDVPEYAHRGELINLIGVINR